MLSSLGCECQEKGRTEGDRDWPETVGRKHKGAPSDVPAKDVQGTTEQPKGTSPKSEMGTKIQSKGWPHKIVRVSELGEICKERKL